jgi:non-heme chloroperoxidase
MRTVPFVTRRAVMAGAGAVAAATSLPLETLATPIKPGARTMSFATMKDGAKIYYKDWGSGPVVTFSHGWPLSADAWDAQMMFLGKQGYRVIAHDRRGHGRSDQTWHGNDMDTYADDLATLLDTLDIKGATMVGHSTGGGEVARYLGRHGVARVAKAVLISAIPPHMLQTPTNPIAAPMSVFDGLRAGLLADRAQFYKDFPMVFYGYNKPGAKISQGQIDSFFAQAMMGSIEGQYDCIAALSETDFTDDLKTMTIPTLLLHGVEDQVVPIDIASRKSIKILPKGTLKEIAGAPHGMCVTHAADVNAALLAFIKGDG